MKTLKQLLDTYKLVITPLDEEDGLGFIARYEELGYSVRGVGATQAEALANLEDLALDGFEDMDISELPIAASSTPWAEFNGRVTLRLPKMLHAKISRQAEEQGVSLNQWMCHILESATTAVAAGCEFGARPEDRPALVEQVAEMREQLDRWASGGSYSPLVSRSRDQRPMVTVPLKLVKSA
jgi:antitoxin HicB